MAQARHSRGIWICVVLVSLSAWSPALLAADADTPAGRADTPLAAPAKAATPAPTDAQTLPEMVVTATRGEHAVQTLPQSAVLITGEELRLDRLTPNLPEALSTVPGVMIQKTANGQGSPYIRGFTGFRNVLLVDGIRYNTSVFREGPNQYWSLIDPFSLDRLELIKGPGAVMYGSDAVGGTVNAISAPTGLALAPNACERHLFTRVATADESAIGRMEVIGNVAGRLGYELGGTWQDFGDIRGGREVGEQAHTGYDEWNGDAKLDWLLAPNQTLTLAHRHTTQDDVWRTHRTIYGTSWEGATVGTDKRLSYDQSLDLTYLQYHAHDLDGIVDAVNAGVSWMETGEHEYKMSADSTRSHQGFDVATLGAFLSLEIPSEFGRWTTGCDWYHDRVDSWKRNYKADGTLKSIDIQGPVADAATYDLAGVFLQDEIPLGERVTLTLGGRYSYAQADADKVKDPLTGTRTSLSDDWQAAVGQARLMVALDEPQHWNWFTGVGQSFRAPNLSDLTRFDIARTKEMETPSPGLDAEHFLTYETGLKAQYDRWSGELALFRTEIQDMIVRRPTGRTITQGGKTYNEVVKTNGAEGYVDGLELSGAFKATEEWTVKGALTWMDGEVDGYPTSTSGAEREPVSRLMPAQATGSLRYEPLSLSRKWFAEVACTVADSQADLSSGDRADTQRFPPDGTPGYTTVNVATGYAFTPRLRLTAALNNITNEDYRIHGSGVNEPGRNLVVALDARF